MKYGLKEGTIKQIEEVFARFPSIEKVILYGSRAKGNFKDGSDIDITLLGGGLDLKTLHQIENALDDLFLPYKFDVSIFNQISNDKLVEHINRVGIIFYVLPAKHD